MNTPHTKNPNAVALGKLGGKPKGGRGRTLTSQEAQRISGLRWAKRKEIKENLQ